MHILIIPEQDQVRAEQAKQFESILRGAAVPHSTLPVSFITEATCLHQEKSAINWKDQSGIVLPLRKNIPLLIITTPMSWFSMSIREKAVVDDAYRFLTGFDSTQAATDFPTLFFLNDQGTSALDPSIVSGFDLFCRNHSTLPGRIVEYRELIREDWEDPFHTEMTS